MSATYAWFFCMTPMHSMDYAVARCLSVRHTPSGIQCKVVHIPKLFSPLGSPTILVFPHQTGSQNCDGDPANGDVKCKGDVKKMTIFDQYLAFSQK